MNAESETPTRRRWRLSDRRVRTKLALIVALPVLVIIVLGGDKTVDTAQAAKGAAQAREQILLARVAGDLIGALQQERATAALLFEQYSDGLVKEYEQRSAATDTAAARFEQQANVAEPASATASGVLARLASQTRALTGIRSQVSGAARGVGSVVLFRYRALIADLLLVRQSLSQVSMDPETLVAARAAADLSEAIESFGLLQVSVTRALGYGQLTPAAQQEVLGSHTRAAEALQNFADLASPSWRRLLNATVTGDEVLLAERLRGAVVIAAPGSTLNLGVSAAQWSAALGRQMELMRMVEAAADDDLAAAVTRQRDARWLDIAVRGAILLVALVLLIVLAWWVARSLIRHLTRLRESAVHVAEVQLPALVEQIDTQDIREGRTVGDLVAAAAPVHRGGTDEIGQVAVAFDSVVQRAAALAAGQAELRRQQRGTFLDLAWRLQRGADEMIKQLDVAEQDEQDPVRLEHLFQVDQGLSFLRRIIGSLFTMAGHDRVQVRPEPVALPDVVKAAFQGVKGWERIYPGRVDDDVLISGAVVEELVRLLAELLANAVAYSDASTQVTVHGRATGDVLHMHISDAGIGMNEQKLADVRHRLAHPERADHPAGQMGLAVVARVARSLGVDIEIRSWPIDAHRPGEGHGTRVDLRIPEHLFTIAGPQPPTPTPAAVPDPGRTREMATLQGMPIAGRPPTLTLTGPPAAAPAQQPVIYQQIIAGHPAAAVSGYERTANGLPMRHQAPAADPVPASPGHAARVPAPRRSPEQIRDRTAARRAGLRRANQHPAAVHPQMKETLR